MASSRRRSPRATNGVQLMIVPKAEVADAGAGAGDVQRGRCRRPSTRRSRRCSERVERQCRHRRRPRRDHEWMTDTSDLPLTPARDDHAHPEAIADRTFSQVQARLRRIRGARLPPHGVERLRVGCVGRERDLTHRVRELEEQCASRRSPPSDQDLITALGEETARVLGQARESAVELRNKAEEHARRVVREAQETPRELRTTTQQAVETEDPARPRTPRARGRRRSWARRARCASACSPTSSERRQELERQIADLRDGRGKLVETYELVERALGHAARPDGARNPRHRPRCRGAEATDAEPRERPQPHPTTRRPPRCPCRRAGGDRRRGDAGPSRARRARRACRRDDVASRRRRAAEPTHRRRRAVREAALRTGRRARAIDEAPAGPPQRRTATLDRPRPSPSPTEPGVEADAATARSGQHRSRRDAARRGQRRPRRGGASAPSRTSRTTCSTVCAASGARSTPPRCCRRTEDQLARWAHVLQPAVDRAYAAGAAIGGRRDRDRAPRPGAAHRAATSVVVTRCGSGWRRRSSEHRRAARPPTPRSPIAQSLGARYREWRGEQLEGVLGDVLAAATSGACSTPRPTVRRLRWVPAVVGQVPRLRRQRARAHGEGAAISPPVRRTRRRTPAAVACSSSTPTDD